MVGGGEEANDVCSAVPLQSLALRCCLYAPGHPTGPAQPFSPFIARRRRLLRLTPPPFRRPPNLDNASTGQPAAGLDRAG